MTNIICHIAGIDGKIKEDFIKYMTNSFTDVVIKDLDEVANIIKNDDEFYNIEQKILKARDRSKLIQEMNTYWKTTFENKINYFLSRNKNKKIIFIGLNTFHYNDKIRINIDTSNKMFLKMDIKGYTKDIIDYNINTYKNQIISGTFPIKLIDYNYIIEQRNKTEQVYLKMNYKLKTYNDIKNWIKMYLHENKKINPNIYIGSTCSYNEMIKTKKANETRIQRIQKLREFLGNNITDTIYAYKYDWIAILSSVSGINNMINKGFKQIGGKGGELMVPFIEEQYAGAFNNLNKECHLYQVDKSNFKKNSWYKYYSNSDIPIVSKIHIPNILNYLNENGVSLIKYKTSDK